LKLPLIKDYLLFHRFTLFADQFYLIHNHIITYRPHITLMYSDKNTTSHNYYNYTNNDSD